MIEKHPPENKIRRRIILGVLLTLCVLAICGGIVYACTCLTQFYNERCRITDAEFDVVITTGRQVVPEVIIEQFGLTNGANLADIDFEGKRKFLLDRIPNIRKLTIERRMPNRVTVNVTERDPIARIARVGNSMPDGRVTDIDGVVFRFERNVNILPIIREPTADVLKPGETLHTQMKAALTLVDVASAEFSELRIQEIGTEKKDYLDVVLGDYSRARIAWAHMGSGTTAERESVKRQLFRLSKAIHTRLAPHTTLWTVTDYGDKGRIYARDTSRATHTTETIK